MKTGGRIAPARLHINRGLAFLLAAALAFLARDLARTFAYFASGFTGGLTNLSRAFARAFADFTPGFAFLTRNLATGLADLACDLATDLADLTCDLPAGLTHFARAFLASVGGLLRTGGCRFAAATLAARFRFFHRRAA